MRCPYVITSTIMAHEGAWVHGVLCRCEPAHPGQAVMVVVREMAREGQQLFKKSIRVTFIPGNGFGRAGVDGEPERGGPPSVRKPGDLQLGFAIGAGVLGHLSSASEGLTGPAGELILIAHRLF